ncbi:MAG: hypothetical protein IT184_10510 [Acidobacteria bacterium]|nr:hypothetical protein [Acidobacteriota bacterium]
MPRRSAFRLAATTGALCVAGLPLAAAQAAGGAREPGTGRFGAGGELTATVSRRDQTAYFNYTDYDRNALRIARLRLFGEWRPAARLSFLAEIRSENADGVEAAALYARWQPIAGHDLFVQGGRIPPVIGAFARHAYGRDNLVSGLPLAYQYLTSLRPDAVPATVDDLLRMSGRGWQPSYPIGSTTAATGVPLVTGSRWDTGVSLTWRRGWIETAAAVTLGSPAVPVVRETNGGRMWSGRIAAHLPDGLAVGLSAARGRWLDEKVLALVPGGLTRPASESVLGVDAEFGAGRWLFRHEWWRATFDLPLAADATNLRLGAWSGFVEGRYRFHPRWQTALRAERLAFARVRGGAASDLPWDADVDRLELVLGFRASRHAEIRAGYQHNWREGGRIRARGFPTGALIYWF